MLDLKLSLSNAYRFPADQSEIRLNTWLQTEVNLSIDLNRNFQSSLSLGVQKLITV